MKHDFLFALRSLARAPGFFCVAVVTLALGIAANAAIFSLFYQVLLRTLPVAEPERLVLLHADDLRLRSASSDNSETVFSYPMYLRLRDGARAFRGMAARSSTSVRIASEGSAERGQAEIVSGNYFETLGARPHLGRLLTPADDSVRGGNPVAVLSYDFWQRRVGASAAVLDRKLLVNGQPLVVVGVAPERFRGILAGDSPDLFVPISMRAALSPGWDAYDNPGSQWLTVFGRLNPRISRERAGAELQPLFAAVLDSHIKQLKLPADYARRKLAGIRMELRPAARGLNELEKKWRQPLFVLLAMAALLLLIACANVANLLLARGVNRGREIAVRMALGAGRLRIARLLFAESAMLALAGTLAGVLLSPVLTHGVLGLMPEGALGGWISADVNLPVLGWSTLLLFAATLLFGLAPAFQAVSGGLAGLGDRSQTGAGRVHARARKVLVAAQIALSLVLLAAAGLFGRSMANLARHNPGFRADHLLTFAIDPGLGGYTVERGTSFYRDATRKLASLPGVEAVSLADAGPLSNHDSYTNVAVEGFRETNDEEMMCSFNSVGPAYFRTLATPLLAGREFDERDTSGAAKVAVVNQAFVHRFLRGTAPVGRLMSIGSGGPLDITIVGVATDVNAQSLREPARPTFYIPYEQAIGKRTLVGSASFFVRARSGFESLPQAARAVITRMDSTIPVYNLHTMQVQVQDSVYTDRLIAALSTAFGILAAILTAVGLYGVIGYLVSRRRAEIGIRMALGAVRADIVKLVMTEVLVLTAAGGIAGLIGAVTAGRAIASQLFGVNALDPAVLILAPLSIVLVAAAAGCLPAWRASRVEPVEALRHE